MKRTESSTKDTLKLSTYASKTILTSYLKVWQVLKESLERYVAQSEVLNTHLLHSCQQLLDSGGIRLDSLGTYIATVLLNKLRADHPYHPR